MPSLPTVKASNTQFQPSFVPVAVFVGGTAGIGKATVELLVRVLKGQILLVIVGRNEAAAQAIIASLPPASGEGAGYEFIPCDVTVMRNVHNLSKTLCERLPKINFLVLSAGVFSLKGWEGTEDGLDKKLASRYYSRWALTNDLLPLLRKTKDAGEDAKVMSIMAAGYYSDIDVNNLGQKKSFVGRKAMMQSISYNDLMMAEFAERNPEISFIHTYPGFVNTHALKFDHWLAILLSPLLKTFFWAVAITPEVCAEYTLYALLGSKPGLSRRNEKGDDIGMERFPVAEGAQKKLWDHSVEATKSSTN